MFLGPDIGAWLVLALGAAMAVGHLVALLRPPPGSDPLGGPADSAERQRDPEHYSGLERRRAPLGRSLLFIAVGLVAAIWALASLAS